MTLVSVLMYEQFCVDFKQKQLKMCKRKASGSVKNV